jgi:NADP-dependent 3-hydroxy acid dehydrogenase YdfG
MTDVGGKVVAITVAITGASSGIGEATARLLAERGASVVLGARRTERLDDIAREIRDGGGAAVTCPTDVARREDLERLVGAAVDEFGQLDVLVSNAGISKVGPISDLDVDGWSAMIDVNLRGVLHGIAAALPVFRRQGRGHFVTTVSTAGLKIVPTMAVYAATKNAVRTLMEGLRQESTDGAVRTTSISPGFVDTQLDSSIDDVAVREQIRRTMNDFGSHRRRSHKPSRSPSNSPTTWRSATSPSARQSRASRRPAIRQAQSPRRVAPRPSVDIGDRGSAAPER